MGLSIEEQKAVEKFRKEVVDPSQNKLVILDFWAEWCGPCKALTPVLEKVVAEYADKGVMLAKINVDEDKFIASQFQVQSIPTVYAMFQGQPVADLTPARTESQLKQALDEILKQVPVQAGAADDTQGQQQAPDLDQLVGMGEQVLADGDAERAASVFMQLAQMAPDKAEVQSGLIRSLVAAGQADAARQAYDALSPEMQNDPLVQQAHSALELAGTKVDTGELDTLRKAAAERPADTEAQIAFAEAAFAAGERDEAAEVLLRAIEGSDEDGKGEAREKLLKMFEAVGMEDPWVSTQRRKLSLLLFG
ncbi:tetratricopeptide repeat protein [Aurantiacibacter poecillastricola]|uniref:tetratricopeptide repeat protein n=1 Tax=Aurantiacibacter poecillastricola TaxID=3064385 RepID=UPI00273DCC4D|nr:tetratricopeptide repeat protein [Aurantiacibacter sp. 219JJ12-13]MDP5260838.1 tetratricopeptide repeat protein [Aurantiacibacter sp. 219JJ12-13]